MIRFSAAWLLKWARLYSYQLTCKMWSMDLKHIIIYFTMGQAIQATTKVTIGQELLPVHGKVLLFDQAHGIVSEYTVLCLLQIHKLPLESDVSLW